MDIASYRQVFRVRSYETDPQGRLQVPILCKLLQEAATAHASLLGVAVETLIDDGLAWVLARFHLTMECWPGADEKIVVETWPAAKNRLFTERRFKILDADNRPFGKVSTLWLVLDLERRRPVRLPTHVVECLDRLELDDEPMRPDELSPPDPADHEIAFTVRRSDLDLAAHVNNTSYVEWVVEAIPDEVWTSCQLADLDIGFLSECHRGQTVLSRSQVVRSNTEPEVRHQLVRNEDGVEVARALTRWRRHRP